MVNTQIIKDNSVVVPEVLSNGPGWIVVYADDNGSPGEMLGFSPVFMGFNVDVFVKIDPEKTIPMLFAMLHEDAGQEGVFEFPGVDEPVIVSGEVVSKAFPASDPFVEPFGLPEDIGK